MFNLVKAVTHRLRGALFTMGRRAGLIIGLVLFLTILGTFQVMYLQGRSLMERISLGAFIIALCMLTDNAIVVNEAIKVGIESGRDKLEVIREAVAQNQWPLFGATAIAVIAFAAIGLSEDSTGEYCNSLFWVIFILADAELGWRRSQFTPLLGYVMYKPIAAAGGTARRPYAYGSRLFRTYRGLLVTALRYRWAVVMLCIGLTIAAVYGFRMVTQSFFPPATRPQFLVDVFCRRAPIFANRKHLRIRFSNSSRSSPGLLMSPRSSAAAGCAFCSFTLRKARTRLTWSS